VDIDYSIQYDKWHDDTDRHYEETARFYRRLLAPVLSEISVGDRVLDVGCGTGLLVHALRSLGYTAARGIDLSPQQIQRAQRRGLPCATVGPEELFQMAKETPGSVDVVFLMDVLEHIPVASQLDFVRALSELLVPGGTLVLSVPNASSAFASRQQHIDWTHHCSFTEHGLEFVLRNAGFASPSFFPYEFAQTPAPPYIHSAAFWTGLLRRTFRGLRRLEAIGEFGRQGLTIPLSLNLLARCRKAS
jgi:2-polyprenyl-3-methyl-5-hydroxy-6-metoxy-1,4-benzoquinol methylase